MTRRTELRDKALDYTLEHGLAGLSLRPLAEQLGTSARLLIFHFGSKEGLITAVMDEVRNRVQRSFMSLMQSPHVSESMRSFWEWTTSRENSPYVRLLFEVQVLALQNPAHYGRYLEDSSSSWRSLIEASLPPSPDRRTTATLCAAVIDGLVMEYFSTGDLERTTAALGLFLDLKNSR
jgi:AcrR family transcriptional regulator